MATCSIPRPGRLAATGLSAGILLFALAGCGPEVRARQSLGAGQPVEAARLFRQAVDQKPQEPGLRVELARAQRQAAESLALQAEQAMAAGQHDEAGQLAGQASRYDAAFDPLLRRVHAAQAASLVRTAEAELDGDRFEVARSALGRASSIDANRDDVMLVGRAIDEREADVLAARALNLAGADRFDASRRLADRAVRLAPGRDAAQDLVSIIDRLEREARFDALAATTQQHLDHRTLGAASETVAQLAALGVRRERLQGLQDDLGARVTALQSALDAARDRRAAGHFDEAIRLYETASAMVSDRPDISREREACRTDLQFAQLVRQAALESERGDFEQAIDDYRAALQIRGDETTAIQLRGAEAAFVRIRLHAALDDNERGDAVQFQEALLRLEPDAAGRQRLQQLREDLVDATLAEASSLDVDGRPDEAIELIRQAISIHADPALEARLADVRVRWLLEQAAAADRNGRIREARDLYLEALVIDGERPAIAARIDDSLPVAEMQRRTEQAEAIASGLERTVESLTDDLAARERRLDDLLADLQRSESSIDDLTRANDQLAYDVHDLRRKLSHLEREAYDLKCDNDRLQAALHQAKRDADEWRRRYERERTRPRADGRHDGRPTDRDHE